MGLRPGAQEESASSVCMQHPPLQFGRIVTSGYFNFGRYKFIRWEKSQLDENEDFMIFHQYTDQLTNTLIGAVCEVAGAPLATVLEIFGEYFLQYCLRHGYDKMLRTLGGDFKSFIQNLDSLHSLLAMSYKNIEAPSFRCEELEDKSLQLHYYTIRPGLYPIVLGLVKAVSRDLYEQEAKIKVENISQHQIEDGKTQQHVVFRVTLHNKSNEKNAQQSLDRISPYFPAQFKISGLQFCSAFPYHLIFDEKMAIRQCGLSIQRLIGCKIKPGVSVHQYFTMIHPRMDFTVTNIQEFINTVFMLSIKSTKNGNARLVLKGQMIWLPDIRHMIFISSPRISSLTELMEMNVFLSDIPIYDVTRELVLLNQQRIAEIDIAKKLDETTAELKKTSMELELEKKKTEILLYQMLPPKVAIELKNGRSVEAEKFDQVTILFSDIVTFTNIAAASTPMDIVSMLNALYQRFDKKTNEHGVYKVETIGDAYMVVGGVPEKTERHAEPVADFSVDMVHEAEKVSSPATGKPLQIRVGFHSGPVVAGVVGLKMPRYCLFGDTVNTASRMESHGIPARIHVSPTAYKLLADKGYEFRARGQLEVKGKGLMSTYFLLGRDGHRVNEPDDAYMDLPIAGTEHDEESKTINGVKHKTPHSRNHKRHSKLCSIN
ncbi:hypothetical protein FSP39_015315 [Pinctada imbricata]|uniref:guanylate cyclase n=1 Tax=Pinctada imbricata TaxID=66713 RepID=A0AA89CAW4_PINIB|nr:hypothetical protein FSP39_015315 [Pinctada imbricata]